MADKTRFEEVRTAKPVHPLGFDCAKCKHVVKDPTPHSTAMKCNRYPPRAEPVKQQGTIVGWMSITPPVQAGEWCGEFKPILPAVYGTFFDA